jgi:hypothetical protein
VIVAGVAIKLYLDKKKIIAETDRSSNWLTFKAGAALKWGSRFYFAGPRFCFRRKISSNCIEK